MTTIEIEAETAKPNGNRTGPPAPVTGSPIVYPIPTYEPYGC